VLLAEEVRDRPRPDEHRAEFEGVAPQVADLQAPAAGQRELLDAGAAPRARFHGPVPGRLQLAQVLERLPGAGVPVRVKSQRQLAIEPSVRLVVAPEQPLRPRGGNGEQRRGGEGGSIVDHGRHGSRFSRGHRAVVHRPCIVLNTRIILARDHVKDLVIVLCPPRRARITPVYG
jgi:hypothetical protein